MKLKNTTFTWTALILSAIGLLLNLPDIAHIIVTRDPDYLVTCGAFVFMAVATIFGMIQLASLRKQAHTFAESVATPSYSFTRSCGATQNAERSKGT
jgi:hypothetical protein